MASFVKNVRNNAQTVQELLIIVHHVTQLYICTIISALILAQQILQYHKVSNAWIAQLIVKLAPSPSITALHVNQTKSIFRIFA